MVRTRKNGKGRNGKATPRRQSRFAARRKTRIELIFHFLFGTSSRSSYADDGHDRGWSFIGGTIYWGGIFAIWGVLIFGGLLIYVTASLTDPMLTKIKQRPPNITIVANDGTVLAERGLRPGHIGLKRMPKYLINAVLATEDRRFREHFGVDPVGEPRSS